MGCSTTTIKISSITLNAILAIFSFGSILYNAFHPEVQTKAVSIAAYIACSLIIVFALLGVYAAVSESVCLAAVCAVFLLILATLQIASTCIKLSESGKQDEGLSIVERAWQQNKMDDIQVRYECCGKTSAQDYVLLNKQIPISCYEGLKPHENNLFTDGCVMKLQTYYEDERTRFVIISWILITFELICFALAVYLVLNFRNKQRRLQF